MGVLLLYLAALAEGAATGGITLGRCLSELGFYRRYGLNITSGAGSIGTLPLIGKGAFGDIYQMPLAASMRHYLATAVSPNYQLASAPTMIFKKVNITDQRVRNMTLFEINVQTMLQTLDCIPKLYDCAVGKNWIGIVMEKLYKPVDSMLHLFRPLPSEHRLYVYSRIVRSAMLVNNLGIVHADLKPNNIMFTSAQMDDIKLIDYGISCVIGKMCSGATQQFSPPEVINAGLRALGATTTDVWGVLMTLVFCEYAHSATYLEEKITAACYVKMTLECHAKLLAAIRVLMAPSPQGLGDYIANSLTYDPRSRPAMNVVHFTMMRMYTAESIANRNKFIPQSRGFALS